MDENHTRNTRERHKREAWVRKVHTGERYGLETRDMGTQETHERGRTNRNPNRKNKKGVNTNTSQRGRVKDKDNIGRTLSSR